MIFYLKYIQFEWLFFTVKVFSHCQETILGVFYTVSDTEK